MAEGKLLEYLKDESTALRDEIRDINDKAIQVAKAYGVYLLAFFSYVLLGLKWFVDYVAEHGGIEVCTQPAMQPAQAIPALSHSFVLGVKVYSLVGLTLAFIIGSVGMYLMSQWGRSKMHRVRYFRHMDAIRGFVLTHECSNGSAFDMGLMPVNDMRPKIGPNLRLFPIYLAVLLWVFLAMNVAYFVVCWHIQRFVALYGQQGNTIDSFFIYLTPATSLLLLATYCCSRNCRDFYVQLVRAEAVCSKTPYPEIVPQGGWRRVVTLTRFVLLLLAVPACLRLGAWAISPESRGATLHLCTFPLNGSISVWWGYGVFLGVLVFTIITDCIFAYPYWQLMRGPRDQAARRLRARAVAMALTQEKRG